MTKGNFTWLKCYGYKLLYYKDLLSARDYADDFYDVAVV